MGELIRRCAVSEDLEAIVDIAAKAWNQSELKDMEQDRDVVRRTAMDCIRRPDCYLWVLESGGEIHGVIAGGIGPAPGMRGEAATDFLFYVDPMHRGRGIWLLRGFIRWAFGFKSVRYVWLQISIGGDESKHAEEIYLRLGACRTGACFVLRRS